MQTSTLTTADGLTLHVVQWLPVNAAPKAVVLIVHGIGEHSGRYAHVADYFTGRGFAVVAYDHRGHGKSGGERTYFDSFDLPVADVRRVVESVQTAFPALKLFVYGHSMGALISTLYLLRYPDGIAGFISSGTPLTLEATQPAPLVMVGKALSRVIPKVRFAAVEVSALSRDLTVVADYQSDPLVDSQPVRLGMVARLLTAATGAQSQLQRLTLPLLILHGDADRVCPPSGSELLYARAASADKTLHLYPGLYHEMHNEPEQQTVLADIAVWMESH
ncbi:MAG: lysophospholipase [Armatimonadetes bacterium]|nr:lysophospholipase [Anaerolineae bacterium]